MRILELTLHHTHELQRIFDDAATPPVDARYLERCVRALGDEYDPRDALRPVVEHPGLLEFVVTSPSSGHVYGLVFVDMGPVADAIAYWRRPPLYVDPYSTFPHGASRSHALRLATARMEALR